jgi:hypothetical protein
MVFFSLCKQNKLTLPGKGKDMRHQVPYYQQNEALPLQDLSLSLEKLMELQSTIENKSKVGEVIYRLYGIQNWLGRQKKKEAGGSTKGIK